MSMHKNNLKKNYSLKREVIMFPLIFYYNLTQVINNIKLCFLHEKYNLFCKITIFSQNQPHLYTYKLYIAGTKIQL